MIEHLIEKIKKLRQSDRYDEALELCNELIDGGHKMEGIYERSFIYFMQQQYDLALIDNLELLKYKEKKAPTYFVIGEIYRFKKDFQNAVDAYDSAKKEDPEGFIDAGYFKAICHLELENFDLAIKECRKLDPTFKLGANKSVQEIINYAKSKLN